MLDSLAAFTPRQVLLANRNMKIKVEQKVLLLCSVAKYLESNGFSKTLKKFYSEAKLKKDEVECSSLNLEELFYKHFETGNNADKKSSVQKMQAAEIQNEELSCNQGDAAATVETKIKKEKKLKKCNNLDNVAQVSSDKNESSVKKGEAGKEVENPSKSKKKKKNKLPADPAIDDGDEKKQLNESSKGTVKELNSTKDDPKTSEDSLACKENKGSKKRKRSSGEEDLPPIAKESEGGSEQTLKINGSTRSDEQVGGKHNGENGQLVMDLDKNGDLSLPKNKKQKQNGSVEPKKPFQRVNIDEVVFRDKRLQDNSYWAKDGAEEGYGAKAQEVLGQVKGKDFRHEKTKKKRGSYRGGLIDLQSHSVKFDASDDE